MTFSEMFKKAELQQGVRGGGANLYQTLEWALYSRLQDRKEVPVNNSEAVEVFCASFQHQQCFVRCQFSAWALKKGMIF
jgi:hypothetical protein